MTKPAQPPLDLPAHIKHGTLHAHRYYKCRCWPCLYRHRRYDQERNQSIRRGTWRRPNSSRWYVCVSSFGVTHAEHLYNRPGQCIRCGADRKTEELWEEKWKGSKP